MKAILLVLAVLACTAAALRPLTETQAELLFTQYTKQYGKKYESAAEMFKRFAIFRTNMEQIRQHNADETKTFTVAMNQFGDLTNDEFRTQFNKYTPIDNSYLRSKNMVALENVTLPTSVDWNAAGKVTPVKDQGQCGSCWAFSTTGSVEAAYAIEQNTSPISLSEQELVDCSSAQGNQGCNGGLMDQAFTFIISNGGLCTESSYPYKAVDGSCVKSKCTSAVTIKAYTDVATNNEDALQAAVAQQPVSVAVDASGFGWQFYSSGVMSSACGTSLDHGVLAAGYGVMNGTPYWQVKNSWGASWGMNGYILLKRASGSGKPGECGITLAASYPTGASKA